MWIKFSTLVGTNRFVKYYLPQTLENLLTENDNEEIFLRKG